MRGADDRQQLEPLPFAEPARPGPVGEHDADAERDQHGRQPDAEREQQRHRRTRASRPRLATSNSITASQHGMIPPPRPSRITRTQPKPRPSAASVAVAMVVIVVVIVVVMVMSVEQVDVVGPAADPLEEQPQPDHGDQQPAGELEPPLHRLRHAVAVDRQRTTAMAITDPVWAMVVVSPRTGAWPIVPRSPTRYAATSVLPWPGVKAWAMPNTAGSEQ